MFGSASGAVKVARERGLRHHHRVPRVAVTADLHFDRSGYLTSPEVVDHLVLRLQVAQPDAVIIAGDLGHPVGEFAACLQAFRRLSVPVGVVAGNHDVWRDEHCSSRELWERRLPELTEQAGFVWLEGAVLRLGEVAVVGSLAWYDYSAGSSEWPAEHFAAIKGNLNNDAHWIDWPWSDVELAARLREGLRRRLAALEADAGVHEVLVVTHVPLFEEQMTRKPGDPRWELSNAYFGSLTTGRAVLGFGKVVGVVSGHTHCARRATVRADDGHAIAASVIGSEYGRPELELVTFGSSPHSNGESGQFGNSGTASTGSTRYQ
jgi:predicted phosphohydrolase